MTTKDIQYCVNCERNLRIYENLLYCKPCNYIYYAEYISGSNEIAKYKFSSYPELFKEEKTVITCCIFIGYTSKCCDKLQNITETRENEPSHKFVDESIFFDLDLINCWNELKGCFSGANVLYWKNSSNKIIKHTIW